MSENKKAKQQTEPEIKQNKIHVKPGDIIGKIDIHDTRERKDGPGGN